MSVKISILMVVLLTVLDVMACAPFSGTRRACRHSSGQAGCGTSEAGSGAAAVAGRGHVEQGGGDSPEGRAALKEQSALLHQ